MRTKILNRIRQNPIKMILLLVVFPFSSGISSAQLSGTYTIGAGQNYEDIAAAITALDNDGINGPVVFNIIPGTYEVHVTMDQVLGSSETNTITFQSSTQDSSDVILQYSATDVNDNWIVQLNGTDHMRFSHLTFKADGMSLYGTCLWLDGMCDDLVFSNNAFLGKTAGDASANRIICRVKIDNHLNEFFSNIHFTSNYFYRGSYALFFEGYTNIYIAGTVATGNVFEETGYCCVFCNQSVSPVITDNIMEAVSYGIRVASEYSGAIISRNRIYSDNWGIELSRLNSAYPDRSLISNNYVTLGPSGNYGISISNSIHTDVLFNSVYSHSLSWQSAAFYSAYGINTIPTVTVKNNNFCCEDAAYAIMVLTENVISEMSNNNLYTAGNYIANWASEQLFDLKELQERSGLNQNTSFVYPNYVSDSELRPLTPWLDGKGTTVALVDTDIEGAARSDPPDIGAIEFTPDPSTMPPLDGSVEYTIGAGGVYPDFQSAMDDALVRGISAPVTFGFLEGMYDGQFEMKRIPGSGDDKRVTVQSASTSTTWAKLRYTASGTEDNFVFRLYGADFITLKNLVLEAKGTQYAKVIDLYLGTDSIHIENDSLRAPRNTNANANICHIFSGDSDFRNREIRNSFFREGAYSVYMRRNQNNFKYPTGCVISDNEFSDIGYSAMYIQFYRAPVITSNIIESGSRGIQALSCSEDLRIQKNRINMLGGDGIYMTNCDGTEDYQGLVSNNFIHCAGISAARGIYISGSPWQLIYNNSINVTSTNANSYAFDLYAGAATNDRIYNNIFSNRGGGSAIYIYQPSAITGCDYNDYYSLSDYLAYWGENVTDLAALQALNGMDAHSIVCDPQFVSDTDLHTNRECLDSAGRYLADVPDDIDGDMRDLNYPDIGADEFGIVPNQPPYVDKPIPDQSFEWNTGPHEIAKLDTVFIDPDVNDVLTFSATTDVNWILPQVNNDVLSLALGEGASGNAEVYVQATDLMDAIAIDTFLVEVYTPVNHPPVAVDDTVITGSAVTIEVLENDYDPDGDDIRIQDYEYHGSGSVDTRDNDRTLYYVPGNFSDLYDTIIYWIEDSHGAVDTGVVYIQLYQMMEGFYDVPAGLTGLSHGTIKWGDFDDDGDLDLLQTGWTGSGSEFWTVVYENTGEGFEEIGVPFLGVSAGTSASADWFDFDNDNDLDITVTGRPINDETAKRSVLYRNTGGNFETVQNSGLTNVSSSSVSIGDVNHDGKTDLLISGTGEAGDFTLLHVKTGDILAAVDTDLPGTHSGEASLIDLDNDLEPEVFLCGAGIDPCMIYYAGADAYEAVESEVPGMYNASVAWADIDGNSYPDLAIMGTDGSNLYLQIWINTLDNDDEVTFELLQEFTGMESGDLAWADYDNDGDMDLVATGNRSGFVPFTALYRNDESTFTELIGMAELGRSSLDWGDYDNDGDVDLAIMGINGTGTETHIYRNDRVVSNQPPVIVENMSSDKEGDYYIISWEAGTDDITPQTSLTYNIMFGLSEFTTEIISPMAENYFLKKTWLGNAGYNTSLKVLDPGPGEYYWRVQAIDQGFAASSFTAPAWLVITGNDEDIASDGISLYPNPASERITISGLREGMNRVQATDMTGRIVLSGQFISVAGQAIDLDVSHLSEGVYILIVEDEQGTGNFKFSIER